MKRFTSFTEYADWTDQFDNASDCQNIHCIIDDGWKISMDMFTECKSFKTVIRRFEKVYAEVDGISDWCESMTESCESGYFEDKDLNEYEGWEHQIGNYSWGIEEVDDNDWYIYLNISGGYAGRE